MVPKTIWTSTVIFTALTILSAANTVAQQVLPVRVDRWIEIQQTDGTVTCVVSGVSQADCLSSRLEDVGDAVVTGSGSSARLSVDTGIGFINVSENTTIRIRELGTSPDGSRITKLQVIGGQVRLEVRPFTHPSQLEIETPAGISGVRGTTFGVSVQPDGRTGVATLDGSVFAEAQGEQVVVDEGLQSLIVPGEPPSPPAPLQDDPQLDVQVLTRIDRQTVQIVGQTDPVNLLVIEGEIQDIDRSGAFNIQFPLSDDRRIQATVTTPLGTRQNYELRVP